jgi:hypothetical protein
VVVTKATKLEDKLRAYYVRLDGLAFEERLVEAVDLGLMLLQTLGEKMSRQLTTLQVVRKTVKISAVCCVDAVRLMWRPWMK